MEWNFYIPKCEQFVKKDGGSETSQHLKLGHPPGGVAGTDGWLDLPTPASAGMDFRMGLASSRGCYSKGLCVTLRQLQTLCRHLWEEAGEGWDSA